VVRHSLLRNELMHHRLQPSSPDEAATRHFGWQEYVYVNPWGACILAMKAPACRHVLSSLNGRSDHAGVVGHELSGLAVHVMIRIQILAKGTPHSLGKI
jgi:hypothetical protein